MTGPLRFAVGVAISGILVTGLLFGVARQLFAESFRGKLTADVSTRARIIQGKLEEAVLIAGAVASFVRTTEEPDPEAFASFTRHFLAETTGLTALSLVAVVPGAARGQFEAKAREISGKADFKLYEGPPGAEPQQVGERGTYYPVLFTNTRNASARVVLGFDLGSSPIRLTALEESRDTGAATVTARITLFGTAGKPGFIVFAPVYRAGSPASTVEERRAALTGFVQAIFSPEDVIASALRETTAVGLPFDLLDLSAPQDQQVICGWTARLPPGATWRSALIPAGIRALKKFSFAGRDWGIDVRPNAAYLENNYPVVHWLVPPVGLTLTFLLGAYGFVVLSRREALVALNGALESEIVKRARVEEALRASIAELQQAQRNIRTLEGILPICASCKKIRDEQNVWVQVESYVSRHTSAEFSHGFCPDCVKKLFPEHEQRADRRAPPTA